MRAVRSKKIMKERGDVFELGITIQKTHRGSQIRQGILAREDDDGKNSWLVTKLPRIAHKIMMKCVPGMDSEFRQREDYNYLRLLLAPKRILVSVVFN